MPSGGGSSKTVSQQQLSPEQQKLIELVIPRAENYMKTPLKLPPFITTPGKSAGERRAENVLRGGARQAGDLSDRSINTARSLIRQGGSGAVEGFGDLLRGGQSLVGQGRGLARRGNQLINANAGRTGRGLGDLLGGYRGTQGARDFMASGELLNPNNPIVAGQTAAAIRPLRNTLMRDVLPSVRSGSVGNNMFGGTRGGIAEGLAISDFTRQAGDVSANLQAENFARGLEAMRDVTGQATQGALGAVGTGANLVGTGFGGAQAGAGASAAGLGAMGTGAQGFSNLALQSLMASPQLGQMALMPGQVEGSIQAWNRNLQTARRGETAERFNTAQMLPFMQAQDVANLAFGMGGGTTTTTGTQSGGGGGGLGALLGLGQLGMLGYGMGLFSDERLKVNVEPVAKLGDHTWYGFEYTFEPGIRHIGVMAQEVMPIHPEAVSMDGLGYLHVDYNQLLGVY